MEKICVLFSGGKDSSLSAILLSPFFDVELITVSFGITDSWKYARESAMAIGFPWKKISLDRKILEKAVEIIISDGFPRNGITLIHKEALETVAEKYRYIADGVRRDDISPKLTQREISSLESRLNISYISPLAGYSRKTVDELVKRYLIVEEGKSENMKKGDYEDEIRAFIRDQLSEELIYEVFPSHIQSRVIALKGEWKWARKQ